MKKLAALMVAFMLALTLFSQTEDHAGLSKRLEKHVVVLSSDSLEGRGLGTNGKELAKNYIAGQFRDIGLQPFHREDFIYNLELRIGLAWVSGANVVGYLKGSDPELQNEFIVIGAHYDHLGYEMKDDEKVIYHGADDNASGVASVIELARYFATNPQLVKRSILFIAFDAEESGLLGAKAFLEEDNLFDKSGIRAMFSIDMVGMYSANNGLGLEGIGTLNDGENLAKSIAATRDIQLKSTACDIQAGTDTWPFGEIGIPAIHVYTGKKSPYHKPEDTYEKLDYEGMAKIATFLQSLITEMSAATALIPSVQFIRMQKAHALGFDAGVTAGAGSSHHRYPDEFYNAKSVFAYNAGLFMQLNIGQRITLQPEVLYQHDGSKSEEGTFRRQSVCFPVNFHYNIVNEYNGMFKVFPLAGAYYLYSFEGKNGGEELDFDDDYNRQEWGMNLGIGMDIMKVQAKLTWGRNLSELSRNEAKDLISTTWIFSIGYKF